VVLSGDARETLQRYARLRRLRLIVRKERLHPGAQLRFTDAGGTRLTCRPRDRSAQPPPLQRCAKPDLAGRSSELRLKSCFTRSDNLSLDAHCSPQGDGPS